MTIFAQPKTATASLRDIAFTLLSGKIDGYWPEPKRIAVDLRIACVAQRDQALFEVVARMAAGFLVIDPLGLPF
jgi:hypothetical protein